MVAGFCGEIASCGCHHGFAGADVSLDKAVGGLGAGEVLADGFYRLSLGLGEGEREG